jgi:anti-anti-sigma factor
MTNATDILREADVQTLIAPARLTSTERLEFRRDVLELLEVAARNGEAAVTIDLTQTVELDASGLGVLVLLQKRARERGLRTRLLHPTRAVAEMMHLTRLDTLFEFVSAD